MSVCATLTNGASAGVAPALRAVDCMTGEATASAFGRIFGSHGALMPVLTLLLTIYIAFFALSLLLGRGRIGISALTPRMLKLGMVLTFATSWAAYQGVVWNLAVGAPDQIAGVVMGLRGSATTLFADRIDMIFAALAEIATPAGTEGAAAAPTFAQPAASFGPEGIVWLSAMLLLMGTVGTLLTARIALAVLLTLGPVFVVLALFPATRGLFSGWLRAVVLSAAVPLFVVLGGSFMLELLVPVIAGLRGAEGVDGRAALALFTVSSVHLALMVLLMKTGNAIVSAWVPFQPAIESKAAPVPIDVKTAIAPITSYPPQTAGYARGMGIAQIANAGGMAQSVQSTPQQRRIAPALQSIDRALPALRSSIGRAQGIGSRFKPRSALQGRLMS